MNTTSKTSQAGRIVDRIAGTLCTALHDCNSISWTVSNRLKTEMKENGTPVRSGPWLKGEDEIIRENIKSFQETYPDIAPVALLLAKNDSEKKELVSKTNIHARLAQGLNRTCHDVNHRIKYVLYPDHNMTGKYDDAEADMVTGLYQMYGNNWSLLGRKLGRTNSSVKCKWRNLQVTKKGRWDHEEERLLIAAIYDYQREHNLSDDSLHNNIPWEEICKGFAGRTPKQCREHWLDVLRQKYFVENSIAERFHWTWAKRAELLVLISTQGVQHEDNIDFDVIRQSFENGGDMVSRQNIRKAWHKIKSSIPGYIIMSFEEILDQAVAKYT